MKEKLEEYKREKAKAERRQGVHFLDPGDWKEWVYLYDRGLYRYRYMNQNRLFRPRSPGLDTRLWVHIWTGRGRRTRCFTSPGYGDIGRAESSGAKGCMED